VMLLMHHQLPSIGNRRATRAQNLILNPYY
jgi:hypothetical protein